jgi:restriction endonuclease Mrr
LAALFARRDNLHGVVQQQNANAGAIVTTSFFSSDAKEFRQTIENQMHLHDYVQLQKWVEEFREDRGVGFSNRGG